MSWPLIVCFNDMPTSRSTGPDRLEVLLQIADLVLVKRQPVFERLVGLAHLVRRLHQHLDDRLDLLATLRCAKLLARAVQAGIVACRHAERVGQVDLANHARADLVDAVGGLDVGEIGFVDLLEVGLGQFAVAASVSLTILLNGGLYPVA
jgi:hypothetical protein